jgi:putative adenylate-forming enzyme
MSGLSHVASSFLRARWRAWRLRNRADVVRHQQRQIAHFMRDVLPHFPYYRAHLPCGFTDLPVLDKVEMLAHFPELNTAGFTVEQLRQSLDAGVERIGDYGIGRSTGTSGNRGYYVITEAERFVWLGTILAKALPDALWRRHRVALVLPVITQLYDSARFGSRITLGAFDLTKGVDHWWDDLRALDPDTIVAPPKVLRLLAERGALTATRIFSSAEVLDPIDREVIEQATGVRLREIYMATEGLFGVSCAHGTLHLAEDVVHFEWQRPDPNSRLVSPIVTDFTRTAHAMVRYRMNDLLELSDAPCPCGSPYQAVARIEGRQDDIFMLARGDGTLTPVTPDVLRNAMVDADPAVRDFRVVQSGPSAIVVTLDHHLSDDAVARVRAMLEHRLAPFDLARLNLTIERGITLDFDRKLRRIRRDWR